MTALTFDTLEYSKVLQDAGLPQGQAEAIAQAQNKALLEVVNAQNFATKVDLQAIRTELKEDIANTKHEIIKFITNLVVGLFIAQSALFVGIMAFIK